MYCAEHSHGGNVFLKFVLYQNQEIDQEQKLQYRAPRALLPLENASLAFAYMGDTPQSHLRNPDYSPSDGSSGKYNRIGR
jgi:hypothetical protein